MPHYSTQYASQYGSSNSMGRHGSSSMNPNPRAARQDPQADWSRHGYVGRYGAVSPANCAAERPRMGLRDYDHRGVSPLNVREVQHGRDGYNRHTPSHSSSHDLRHKESVQQMQANQAAENRMMHQMQQRPRGNISRANTYAEGAVPDIRRRGAVRGRPARVGTDLAYAQERYARSFGSSSSGANFQDGGIGSWERH